VVTDKVLSTPTTAAAKKIKAIIFRMSVPSVI
jgi:hypothetical protein